MQWLLMIAALSGGSMILMWLGELITERSVGMELFSAYLLVGDC